MSRRDDAIMARHEVPVQFGHLEKVTAGDYAPKAAAGLSPGFQPWDLKIKELALKGERLNG
jgi:hypothetical protein